MTFREGKEPDQLIMFAFNIPKPRIKRMAHEDIIPTVVIGRKRTFFKCLDSS